MFFFLQFKKGFSLDIQCTTSYIENRSVKRANKNSKKIFHDVHIHHVRLKGLKVDLEGKQIFKDRDRKTNLIC